MQRRSLIKKPAPAVSGEDRVSGVSVALAARSAQLNHRMMAPAESGPDPLAEYQSFKAKLEIDRDRLDAAVMEQPTIFDEVGERHIKACDMRDGAKTRLAIKDSELAVKHRARLEKAGSKSTDSIVNDHVLLDPDRKVCSDTYVHAKHAADMWGMLRESYEQRMRMLRELVSLHATGYFNAQSMGGPKNVVRDALADSARRKLEEDRKTRRGS